MKTETLEKFANRVMIRRKSGMTADQIAEYAFSASRGCDVPVEAFRLTLPERVAFDRKVAELAGRKTERARMAWLDKRLFREPGG